MLTHKLLFSRSKCQVTNWCVLDAIAPTLINKINTIGFHFLFVKSEECPRDVKRASGQGWTQWAQSLPNFYQRIGEEM